MKNTWKINFNGSNADFEKTLRNFFDKIKEEVREKVNSSGKKYFNFTDMCHLQCIVDEVKSFMEILTTRSMTKEYVEDFVNNFSIDCFDDDYAKSVNCFCQNLVKYCSVNNCFVYNLTIRFFFMDSSENCGDCSEYVSDSDNDSDIDGDSDCD